MYLRQVARFPCDDSSSPTARYKKPDMSMSGRRTRSEISFSEAHKNKE